MTYVVEHQNKTGTWIPDQEFTTFERAEAIMEDAKRYRLKSTDKWRVTKK